MDPAEPLRVLVVEDDDGIGQTLVRGLERAGYRPQRVASAATALTAPPADLVLLDLGLPDIDGVDLCAMLRRRSDVPIIALTARGSEADRVVTLDAGADDYIVKPFGFAELQARIRAVLRRSRPAGSDVMTAGRLSVDLRARRVFVDGVEVALTPKEYAILECLVEDPGRVRSRVEIGEHVWDAHDHQPGNVLDVHVAALRRKLGDPALVETVYGVGFRLGGLR